MTWFKSLSFEQKVQALNIISNVLDDLSNLFPPYSEKIDNVVNANIATMNELFKSLQEGIISKEEYIRQKERIEKCDINRKVEELYLKEGNLSKAEYMIIVEASNKFIDYALQNHKLPFTVFINDSGKPQPEPDTVENRQYLAQLQLEFLQNSPNLRAEALLTNNINEAKSNVLIFILYSPNKK